MKHLNIPIVTLDGPAGAGKGSVGQQLAIMLGWHFLDSGALYRSYAYVFDQLGPHDKSQERVNKYLRDSDVVMLPSATGDEADVLINGNSIGREIRSGELGSNASKLAADPVVRNALLDIQRSFLRFPGLVADGRDMGSVVFPQAQFKVFLTADLGVRARRKYEQLKNKGIYANFNNLYTEIKKRDERDSNRSCAPLIPPEDALILDTSSMTLNEVVEYLLSLVRGKAVNA